MPSQLRFFLSYQDGPAEVGVSYGTYAEAESTLRSWGLAGRGVSVMARMYVVTEATMTNIDPRKLIELASLINQRNNVEPEIDADQISLVRFYKGSSEAFHDFRVTDTERPAVVKCLSDLRHKIIANLETRINDLAQELRIVV